MQEDTPVDNNITVYLNNEPFLLKPWSHVMDLMHRLPSSDRLNIAEGKASLCDRFGNKMGLEGGLTDGASFFYKEVVEDQDDITPA